MILPLFIFLLLALGGLSLWLGKSTSLPAKEGDVFFLKGKLGLFSVVLALLATQIGGGALLGAAEEAYTRGWQVICYPLGMVFGLTILGMGYGARMRKLQITTISEIFEKIYHSIYLRKYASFLSIFSLFLILVGQGIAARKFFLSLGFQGDLLFILSWLVVITYTARGGLAASVKTEMLQALFIIGVLLMAVGSLLLNDSSPLFSSLPQVAMPTPWLSWLLLPLLFMLIEQDMGQWCFAAKNPRTVSFASLIAAFILLCVSLIPIFFGMQAAAHKLVLAPGQSVLIGAVQSLTNPFIATCMMCAVLMAILSTANALLCSVSTNIVCDFPMPRSSYLSSRAITFSVGVLSLALSFLFNNVVTILMFSYELAVCVLFIPVTLGVWWQKVHKSSAIASMLAGTITFLCSRLILFPIPKEICSLLISLLAFLMSEGWHKLAQKKRIVK